MTITRKEKLSEGETVVRQRVSPEKEGINHQGGGNRCDDDYVGCKNWTKGKGTLRIAFQNVNGLGFDVEQRKLYRLHNFVKEFNIDKLGLAEANTFWPKVGRGKSLWDKTRGWCEGININVGYNNNELLLSQRSQAGGVASLTLNRLAYKITEKGVDPSKLGRWIWTKYQGKEGRTLRIVTAYRPCYSKGINSTFVQQQRFFLKEERDINPRDAFLRDLKDEMEMWLDKGESLIILADINEDIQTSSIEDWRNSLGLREILLDNVGNNNIPNTFERGSRSIGTMMCTANIKVLKAGYLPFGSGVGDHRPLVMDIDQYSVFGDSGCPSTKMNARRLKLQDPGVTDVYLKLLNDHYNKYGMVDKVYEMSQKPITYPLNEELVKMWERLDNIRVQGMRYAERRCRKFKAGKIPWNPKMSEALNIVVMWTLVIKRCKGCKVSTRTILRQKQKAKTNVSLQTALGKLAEAYTAYREAIRTSKEDRETFINDLATARAKAGKIKVANALKQLIVKEDIRVMWGRIHRMDGTARQGGGLTKVFDINEEGEAVEYNDQLGIERSCLEENEKRFTQANKTTMLVSPMVDTIGLLGTGEAAEQILEGDFTAPDVCGPNLQKVLTHLKINKRLKKTTQAQPINCDEYKEGWKKVNERTSSSPSGLHVGHWKCGSTDPRINWINTCLANIPYMSGYSPRRWQRGTNVMIEKKKGVFKVDKLRAILLYEADFNLNNKYLGRLMMRKAEKARVLAPEQYGSRKKKSAVSHALNKRLTFDILRQQKKSGAICSCDLKSCYDRIVHSFATLTMMRAGAAESACVSMFSTIQKLKHHVRTAFGDSEDSFGGEPWRDLEPLMGVGQGNGAGPAIWAVLSTIFFDTLRDNGFGAILKAPFSKNVIHLAGYGFVDDTDLIQT